MMWVMVPRKSFCADSKRPMSSAMRLNSSSSSLVTGLPSGPAVVEARSMGRGPGAATAAPTPLATRKRKASRLGRAPLGLILLLLEHGLELVVEELELALLLADEAGVLVGLVLFERPRDVDDADVGADDDLVEAIG